MASSLSQQLNYDVRVSPYSHAHDEYLVKLLGPSAHHCTLQQTR